MAGRYTGVKVGFIEQFNSVPVIADLRILPIIGVRLGDQVLVTGSVTVADHGGGLYIWNDDSLEVDNGSTVIKPTVLDPLQSGRWYKIYL